jgi:hypothetical protein
MRTIRRDAALFLATMTTLLGDGYAVRFRAGGDSMRPAIDDGAMLTVAPVEPLAVRRGDVLLYRTGRRGFAHRVRLVLWRRRRPPAFLVGGDAHASPDMVAPETVLGRVVRIERNPRPRLGMLRTIGHNLLCAMGLRQRP